MKKIVSYVHVVLLVFISLFFTGCATTRTFYRVTPNIQTASNEYYEASIEPGDPAYLGGGGYAAFKLVITNKTDKDLELDWNRTLFIDNGLTSGGFMFEGIIYRDRHNPKPPDMIFAKSTFSKVIYPNNLVDFFSAGGWYSKGMRDGEFGVLLSVKVNGEEIREKLLVEIVTEQQPE